MKIAVLGAGNVGSALATGWIRAGHQIVFGSRDAQSEETQATLKKLGPQARAANNADAAAQGDIVVSALPWEAAKEVIPQIATALSGKTLIDATNPVARWPMMDHSAGSGGEQAQALAPGARVVKAFNSTGFGNMLEPVFGEGAASMFYAGNDERAKATAQRLIAELGFDAVDCGPLSASLALESLASLWGQLAMNGKLGRRIAFRLLRE